MSVDVLSEILATLELSSQLYFRAELTAPFSVSVPEEKGVIRFHVVAEGSCTASLRGAAPRLLNTGDLILVPHGAAHVLSDAPGRTPTPLPAVLAGSGFDGAGPLLYGGGGEKTLLVCGHFAFDGMAMHPVLATLPRMMHVHAREAQGYAWMGQLLTHIEHEIRGGRAGHREVAHRLSEILLIEVLRGYAEQGDDAALSAIADPQLGRALRSIHTDPAAAWTVNDLARIAGQSRTVFAERFRARMGLSPMRYLSNWRMQKARGLLARGQESVAEVARCVGYASESAFSRSFREHFGAAPGVYRRSRDAA